MKSEKEIEERIEKIQNRLDTEKGHDYSHFMGLRNGLLWVLDDEE